MKNLFILGVLVFSTSISSLSFAQSGEVPETPEIIIDSLIGTANGYSVRNGDDKLNFGLVIPTLTKTQVMDFNLSYVLSSETSVIRAVGQRIEVPSNLSLPMQSERYSFFTVRIDKPDFKLPIKTEELPPEVVILEGSFPFTDTVDTLRAGRPLFTVINSFTFGSYSLSPVDAPTAPLELSVGANSINGEKAEFINPLNEDSEYVSLGLNLASSQQEDGSVRYFPVDVKTLERPAFLKTDMATATTPLIVSIPKTVFESDSDASSLPFPFTMVWGESTPSTSLPLAKDFVSASIEVPEINVDFTELINVDVLGMSSSFVDAEGNEISNTFTFGGFEGIVSVEVPEETVRARIDVYAVDTDPIKTSIILENALTEDDILKEAKYISRYEEDLN